MVLKDFIQVFAEQFDYTPVEAFASSTKFRDLEDWSSLVALSLISLADEEFGVQISGLELRSVSTVEEYYNLIQAKKDKVRSK
jgi:acyl carrier protein